MKLLNDATGFVIFLALAAFVTLLYVASLPEQRDRDRCEKNGNLWSQENHVCLMVVR